MKKICNLLAIMLCCVLLAPVMSCNDDDDTASDITEASIIGKWSSVSGTTDGKPIDKNELFIYMEILENHTGANYFNDDEPHAFKWSLSGNVITMEYVYNGYVYEKTVATIKINGDYATIEGMATSFEGDGESYKFSMVLKKMK